MLIKLCWLFPFLPLFRVHKRKVHNLIILLPSISFREHICSLVSFLLHLNLSSFYTAHLHTVRHWNSLSIYDILRNKNPNTSLSHLHKRTPKPLGNMSFVSCLAYSFKIAFSSTNRTRKLNLSCIFKLFTLFNHTVDIYWVLTPYQALILHCERYRK